MKERPILFSAPMVRALLEGRKTQTRRIVKPQPNSSLEWRGWHDDEDVYGWYPQHPLLGDKGRHLVRCPYGKPGDRLWVKETWWQVPEPSSRQLRDGADTWPKPRGPQEQRLAYAADGDDPATVREWGWKLKPSIFMPRWASRITLEITEVRVQRLQDISEEDAAAEGISTSVVDPSPRGIAPIYPKQYVSNVDVFRDLWTMINGEGSWAANPWTWCVSFRRIEQERKA